MEKVVVFGGSGFVGSHVADVLTERGYEVRIFDLKPSPYLREDQEMIIGDILNLDQVYKAAEGCRYIYNFAGMADLDDATTKPLDTVHLNIVGNTNVLEAARRVGCQRFVYASTIYVYSQLGGFYRCSKQASEVYIEEYQRRYGVDFTVLRYGTIYGPRADERNSVYRYLRQALTEGKIVCQATGEELRDYIYVSDAARLSVDILAEEFKNKHIILTGHYPTKFKDLLVMIKEILNNDVEIVLSGPSGLGQLSHYNIVPYSFTPKIGQKLAATCFTDFGQGLLQCLQEMQDHDTHPQT